MNVKKVAITAGITITIALVGIVIFLIGCKRSESPLPTRYTPSVISPIWQPSSANVYIIPPKTFEGGTEACVIKIEGPIDSNTAGNLAYLHNNTSDVSCKKFLNVNSPGGDVIGAINVGEFIRQKEMDVTVMEGDSCASSCVLLLVGGVRRFVGGKIGLHRPYSTSYSESDSQAKTEYEYLNLLIRKYLNRMNIPDRLLDEMNSVPPSEIKWLSNGNQKLVELHIDGYDPVYMDRVDSVKAKTLGISKEEFYTREGRAKDICTIDRLNPDRNMTLGEYLEVLGKCDNDVMAGKR